MRIETYSLLIPLLGVVFCMAGCAASGGPRARVSLDENWRFTRGDPAGTGDQLEYSNIKPWITATGDEFVKDETTERHPRPNGNLGADVSYTRVNFNDEAWRLLNLPHDFGVEGKFDQSLPGDTGKLPWEGIAWYRKHFSIPKTDEGKNFFLDIDGAMSYSTVWLNGRFVGGWPYGYSSYRLDLTPYIKVGGENVLAIRLDNPPHSSRWYPGGGIYRNVWLVKTSPVHVNHWGTYITTPKISAKSADVKVQVTVANKSAGSATISVSTRLAHMGKNGEIGDAGAEAVSEQLTIPGRQNAVCRSVIAVANPKLWDTDHPNMYVAITTLKQNGKVIDEYRTPFGIRTIHFDPDKGFFLNGKRTLIKGVCDHHDLGPLGAAINERALERQIDLLKEMGCNAIRTSHNPPAPELLDLCDRMGMLIMDESFDCWEHEKTPNDYHLLFKDWHEKDFRAELERDRNHPSIILWSIGNEVFEQRDADGIRIGGALTRIAHEEDPTRPTTAACNYEPAGFNGFNKIIDVFGYNYQWKSYAKFHEANPDQPLFGSETESCVSSRGEYFFPVSNDKMEGRANFQVSSYDLYAPRWAWPPDDEFRAEDEHPYVAGEFVWTGFDYLGEPTPYGGYLTEIPPFTDPVLAARAQRQLKEYGKVLLPSRSSYFGIIDLAGFPKDRFYIYQAHWRPDYPMAHILPHWNWPDRIGKVTPVFVYTSGDSAELFLNGRSLGRKKLHEGEYRLRWDDVKYEPGELKVVAYKNGKRWAQDIVRTTGLAAKIVLRPDRSKLSADGKDLSFVTVSIADKNGLTVPVAQNHVKFCVTGPGEIVATGNGDATNHEAFQSNERDAFNGLCLVIIRTLPGKSGQITLTAESRGLKGAEVTLQSN